MLCRVRKGLIKDKSTHLKRAQDDQLSLLSVLVATSIKLSNTKKGDLTIVVRR